MSLSSDLYDHFADARKGLLDLGKAIGDGLTLAAEVLCPRDHTVEERLRSWEVAAVAVEDEICDEAEACEAEVSQCACGAGYATAAECPWCCEVGECVCWVGHGDCGGCSGVPGISHEPACGWDWNPDCPQHGEGLKASAAVSAAADPSPTVPNAHSVVGGEGRGEDSDILQSAPPERPGPAYVRWDAVRGNHIHCTSSNCGSSWGFGAHRDNLKLWAAEHNAAHCRESDPGEVTAPSPGEQVRQEDLAAHITAAHRQADEIAAYEATYASTGDHIANSLLADFRITRK